MKAIDSKAPDASAEVGTTFPDLTITDEVIRWATKLPATGRATEAHSGHVFTDATGARVVVDASSSKKWHVYKLADVVQLADDNTRKAG